MSEPEEHGWWFDEETARRQKERDDEGMWNRLTRFWRERQQAARHEDDDSGPNPIDPFWRGLFK